MGKININQWAVVVTCIVIIGYLFFPKDQVLLSREDHQLKEAFLQTSSNIGDLSNQLSIISTRLDGIEYQLSKNTELSQLTSSKARSSLSSKTKDKIRDSIHKKSSQEYELLRTNILGKLNDSSTNLTTITQSDEMKTLPKEMQQAVMDEIARRINSGEIDKYQFLPGYKE